MSYHNRAFDFGDGRIIKTCARCKKYKETSAYYVNPRYKDGFNSWCKECFKRPKDHVRERNKILKKYGLTVESFNDVLSAQGGRCAACGTQDPGNKVSWCCDHDHKSGKFRGILCFRCNVSLGHCDDNPSLLRSMADYLDRHQGK